jgi:outer membrane protein
MTHTSGYAYANLSYRGKFDVGGFEFKPYGTIRAKTAKFNTRYYAFDIPEAGELKAGVDYTAGIDAKYHLVSNLYLLAGADATILDNAAKKSALVQDGYEYSAYLGLGAFKEPPKSSSKTITNTPYIRGSWGWATHKDLDQILTGSMPKDKYFNQLVSIFYGHPLTDSLFGLPFEVYLTPGFVLHLTSEVQPNYLREYIIGFKAFYTIPFPIRIRLGAAEGLSYINETTWIEHTDVIEDGNAKDSNLLNYLDFSVGVNLGDLFFTKSMEKAWFGFNIHHRSGIFSNSAQFGRVTGGSNYPSLYLQLHL